MKPRSVRHVVAYVTALVCSGAPASDAAAQDRLPLLPPPVLQHITASRLDSLVVPILRRIAQHVLFERDSLPEVDSPSPGAVIAVQRGNVALVVHPPHPSTRTQRESIEPRLPDLARRVAEALEPQTFRIVPARLVRLPYGQSGPPDFDILADGGLRVADCGLVERPRPEGRSGRALRSECDLFGNTGLVLGLDYPSMRGNTFVVYVSMMTGVRGPAADLVNRSFSVHLERHGDEFVVTRIGGIIMY